MPGTVKSYVWVFYQSSDFSKELRRLLQLSFPLRGTNLSRNLM